MSIGVSPGNDPSGLPRNAITIGSSDASAITKITLTRTSNGQTVQARLQPSTGPSPRVVNDYEVDWEASTVYTAQVTSSYGVETFTSGPVQLFSAIPWAIHPTAPALSFKLDQATATTAGVRTLGNVTRAASDTPHSVLGSPYRVYTKTANRSAPTVQLELVTVTALEASAVRAAVNDLTPLLIRVPPAWGWGWEDGYYRVGDLDEARTIQYGPEPGRVFTLPLERVPSPAGSAQTPRTWATVLNDFPTWAALSAAYNTWTDVITNTRR